MKPFPTPCIHCYIGCIGNIILEGEHMGKDIDDLIFGNAEPVPSER